METKEELRLRYLELLSEKYPTIAAASTEIINLQAILSLPKGTEHALSDIHGEAEQFFHVLKNGSGAVRSKIDEAFGNELSIKDKKVLATIIYYPEQKLKLMMAEEENKEDLYKTIFSRLIRVCQHCQTKYTRSKVRKAMPEDFRYIMEELIYEQADVANKEAYYNEIINTIIRIGRAKEFIVALCNLIQRLVIDHLHIVGDIFDRGDSAEKIVDLLMRRHSLDIEWGNHDILWMGAASGSEACIANVVRNCVKYRNLRTLESGYGVSLRALTLFARQTYGGEPMEAALKAIAVIQFKLEGQAILRHPEYGMDDRLLLGKINGGTVESEGVTYELNDSFFPTVNPDSSYELTEGEREVIDGLRDSFLNSAVLRSHITFLYEKGGMYRCCNGNLLYHGCVPLRDDGSFDEVEHFGKRYSG